MLTFMEPAAEVVGGRKRMDVVMICCAIVGAFIVLLPNLTLGIDGGHLVSWFVAGPIVTLSMIFFVMRTWDAGRHQTAVWSILLYAAFTAVFLIKSDDLRALSRWVAARSEYKAEVLALPNNENGNFRHIEWDGSGFAGIANNVVYLVYDPSDALSGAAKNHRQGKFKGLPCEVYRVRRLESRWYSVDFYTDTSWDHCN